MGRWLKALAIASGGRRRRHAGNGPGRNLGYRLGMLEEQVRQLVGQIQELQHQLRQIERAAVGAVLG